MRYKAYCGCKLIDMDSDYSDLVARCVRLTESDIYIQTTRYEDLGSPEGETITICRVYGGRVEEYV